MSLADKWAQETTTSPQRLEKLVSKSIKVARLLAANPSSRASTLEKIAATYPYCNDLNAALASHPYTPFNLLLKLSSRFPKEVSNNPSVIKANNGLLSKLSVDVLDKMLMQANLPTSFIKNLLLDSRISVVISAELRWELNNLNTQKYLNISLDYLEEIAQKGLTVPYLFAANESTPEYLLERLDRHFNFIRSDLQS
jgi:hypothetical protein